MSDVVDFHVEGRVAHVVLNRPDKRNAINLDMFDALAEAGDRIAADTAIRAVVLSGAGDSFCAGIDVTIMSEAGELFASGGMRPVEPSIANRFQRAAWVWQEVPVPVACALDGVVFGGGLQIALGADVRFASPAAKLSIMEVKWGLVPDMAITATARHLVPLDRLKELAFTGRIVTAAEALEAGLVTALEDDPQAAASAWAETVAGQSPDAVRAMKRLFNQGFPASDEASLALEAELQVAVMSAPNQAEAVRANLEKRVPDFVDSDRNFAAANALKYGKSSD
jgi:enoyl-CoA hydratase/carnithine racemase